MNRVNEQATGFWAPRPPALDGVLVRLEALSRKPEFALQREIALAQALRPYLGGIAGRLVAPLAQETELATLFLLCDFYPQDGQLTLIEQLRDVITEHIPNEERQWLDHLKHSSFDLLELTETPTLGEECRLRSLGDGTRCVAPGGEFIKSVTAGQVLLTRVIGVPDSGDSGKSVWAGCGVVLSSGDAKVLLDMIIGWRQEMEISSGSFALGEWREFTKRFGYMILWAFAQLRMDVVADAVAHIGYRHADGRPYLYARALYDHHEQGHFIEVLTEMNEFVAEDSNADGGRNVARDLPRERRWVQRENGKPVARLTLTASQLFVECDSPQRLDQIKHRLAASLGFSLHFRDETVVPPARQLSVTDLVSKEPLTLVVTPEEDHTLLNQFLENAYLEWSDQPHHALSGQTPRHAAATPTLREKVGALIDDMERHDPGHQRLGRPAFNYNRLRAHVGLDEVSE